MYEEYYGFEHSPFSLVPDARFFYMSAPHQEALEQLRQAIQRRERFTILTGPSGTGKTTLCRALLERLDTTTFTSLILNPFLSVEELLREVLVDYGVISREAARSGRASTATRNELAGALRDFLQSLAPLGANALLVIDEAQHVPPPVLEELRVLTSLDAGPSGLHVVLVGQPALLDVLAGADMRQLDQRIALRATLGALTRDAVGAYVAHRLSIAGGASGVTFAPRALDRIHARSSGIPRVINLLCDRALMLGAEANRPVITEDLVKQAAAGIAIEPAGTRRWRGTAVWVTVAIVVIVLVALALATAIQV